MRSSRSWLTAALLLLTVQARADAMAPMVDLHLLIGTEPRSQGNPIAFGVGGELLWHGRVGVFAALLSSEGSPIVVMSGAALGDRISVPFGFAARPFLAYADTYLGRLATGLGVQVGPTVEHLRTSLDGTTTAGLHLGASFEVPFYGCLDHQSGVALRVFGRALFTPRVSLAAGAVTEPAVSGQFFVGLAYYP